MEKNQVIFIFIFFQFYITAQTDTVIFIEKSEFDFSFVYSAYTSEFDKMERPYLYSACRELGVVTFDISDIENPFPTDTISVVEFESLRPTNLVQYEQYLFVSLGGFDGLFPQKPGLAIVEMSDPENPELKDIWISEDQDQGSAIVITDGNYAFLGAMDDGVIILNVADKENISFVSHILPDPNFPDLPGLFTTPNARGLHILNDTTLLVANDHGGLRWIDISEINTPVEVGKYINTTLFETAGSAYNNIAVKDHFAFISVDYCGVDVVDVSDSEMENVFWLNPWDCNFSNWDGSPGHTNGVKIEDNLLFVSGGDSEVLIFDITNPPLPILVGQFAEVYDSVVAWSLDVNDSYVSLALVNNSIFGVPYYSNVGGIRLLEWEAVPLLEISNSLEQIFEIYPNPFNDKIQIKLMNGLSSIVHIQLFDAFGNVLLNQHVLGNQVFQMDAANIPKGVYFIEVETNQNKICKILVKEK